MDNVYISGALTNVTNSEEVRSFYEAIGEVCAKAGLSPYVPHKHTDPEINNDVSPQAVFDIDRARVISSDLLIAYVGIQSLGVGMELGFAYAYRIPIVLLYQTSQRVSRMVRGIPETTKHAEIIFDDYQDALKKLSDVLDRWVQERAIIHQDVVRPQFSNKMMFRLETDGDDLQFEIDLVEAYRLPDLLEKRLLDLKESGIEPSGLYFDIWLYSLARDVFSKVWPCVPVFMEYGE